MLRIMFLLAIPFSTIASDIFEKLRKMDPPPQIQQVFVQPRKFVITEEFSKKKKFKGVLKRGALIQDLNGENYYTAKNNIVLNAIEVSLSSPYVYLIGSNNMPILVCFSNDITNIDRVVKLDYDHVPFTKEKYQYRSIDFDQYFLFDAYFTSGTHRYDFSEELKNSHHSYGLNIETGFKEQKFIPFKITVSANKLDGDILDWSYFNMGLKIFKRWDKKNSSFALSIEAQRTILSAAKVVNLSTRLYENRFSVGATYQYKNVLGSFEFAKERILFPAEINFNQLKLNTVEGYQTSLLLKLGYSFEKLL